MSQVQYVSYLQEVNYDYQHRYRGKKLNSVANKIGEIEMQINIIIYGKEG